MPSSVFRVFISKNSISLTNQDRYCFQDHALRVRLGTEMRNASGEWQFINLNRPKQSKDKEVRRVVRSNAQRDFRRKQRQSGAAKHRNLSSSNLPADSEPISPIDATGGAQEDDEERACSTELGNLLAELRVTEFSNRNQAVLAASRETATQTLVSVQTEADSEDGGQYGGDYWPNSPNTVVGATPFDPFNTLPVEGDTRFNSFVMHHCKPPLSFGDLHGLLSIGTKPYKRLVSRSEALDNLHV